MKTKRRYNIPAMIVGISIIAFSIMAIYALWDSNILPELGDKIKHTIGFTLFLCLGTAITKIK